MVQINFARREVNVKIVYYGPGRSGKTTNLEIIHQKAPKGSIGEMTSIATETDRTLFFDFLPLDLGKIAGMNTKFQLYTVPGQVYYKATRKLVLAGADGVVFVADSQAEMMEENEQSLKDLEENLRENGLNIEEIPLVLQWNKRDLPNIVPVEEMNRRLNRWNAPTIEAVAIQGEGVFQTLKTLAGLVIKKLNREQTFGIGTKEEAKAAPSPSAAPSPTPASVRSSEPLAASPPAPTGGVASPTAPPSPQPPSFSSPPPAAPPPKTVGFMKAPPSPTEAPPPPSPEPPSPVAGPSPAPANQKASIFAKPVTPPPTPPVTPAVSPVAPPIAPATPPPRPSPARGEEAASPVSPPSVSPAIPVSPSPAPPAPPKEEAARPSSPPSTPLPPAAEVPLASPSPVPSEEEKRPPVPPSQSEQATKDLSPIAREIRKRREELARKEQERLERIKEMSEKVKHETKRRIPITLLLVALLTLGVLAAAIWVILSRF